jgi:hypothetical protein
VEKFIATITAPIHVAAFLIGETREQNLDGSYNEYWARKNQRAELREHRKKYRAEKKAIKYKYMVIMTHH